MRSLFLSIAMCCAGVGLAQQTTPIFELGAPSPYQKQSAHPEHYGQNEHGLYAMRKVVKPFKGPMHYLRRMNAEGELILEKELEGFNRVDRQRLLDVIVLRDRLMLCYAVRDKARKVIRFVVQPYSPVTLEPLEAARTIDEQSFQKELNPSQLLAAMEVWFWLFSSPDQSKFLITSHPINAIPSKSEFIVLDDGFNILRELEHNPGHAIQLSNVEILDGGEIFVLYSAVRGFDMPPTWHLWQSHPDGAENVEVIEIPGYAINELRHAYTSEKEVIWAGHYTHVEPGHDWTDHPDISGLFLMRASREGPTKPQLRLTPMALDSCSMHGVYTLRGAVYNAEQDQFLLHFEEMYADEFNILRMMRSYTRPDVGANDLGCVATVVLDRDGEMHTTNYVPKRQGIWMSSQVDEPHPELHSTFGRTIKPEFGYAISDCGDHYRLWYNGYPKQDEVSDPQALEVPRHRPRHLYQYDLGPDLPKQRELIFPDPTERYDISIASMVQTSAGQLLVAVRKGHEIHYLKLNAPGCVLERSRHQPELR